MRTLLKIILFSWLTNVALVANTAILHKATVSSLDLDYHFEIGTQEITIEPEINPVATTLSKPLLNFPNPFSLSQGTTIGFQLSEAAKVKLQVFDSRGKRLYEIVIDSPATYHEFDFNAASINNFPLESGIYFYHLILNNKVIASSKMAILP